MLLCFRVVLCTVPACPILSPPSHHNRLPQRGSRPPRSWRHLLGGGSPKPRSWHLAPTRKYSFQRRRGFTHVLAAAVIQFSDGGMATRRAPDRLVASSSLGWTAFGFFVFVSAFLSFVLWDCHIFFMISFTCLFQLLCSGRILNF